MLEPEADPHSTKEMKPKPIDQRQGVEDTIKESTEMSIVVHKGRQTNKDVDSHVKDQPE